jgi:hemolysin D
LDVGGDALIRFQPPSNVGADLVAVQRQLLASQMSVHSAKVAAVDRQMQQRLGEQATIAATIAKLQATIPLIRERYEIRDEMARKQLGSKIAFLESMQALVESEKELVVQRSQLTTAEAAAAVLSETRAETVAEFRRAATAELAESERKAASLQEELVKAEQRTKMLSLIAPIDGTVQQLAIHTVGGVVTSAQALLVLAPSVSPIEIEATISNRDIGFVRVGQEVEIKIDAFDFTRFGLIRGKVESISRDTVTRNGVGERDAERGRGNEPRAGDEKAQETTFAARIILERGQMDVDGVTVELAPGMAASVEIKTGMRSVLSFLMSPIARYRQSTLRER